MKALEPSLEPGRVYRTKDFAQWAKNPFALATRLVHEGKLTHLGYGLYHHPKQGLLGPRPPTVEALVSAFLGGRGFLFTGTTWWNTLALGTTQEMVVPFVYNTQRSGLFKLGSQRLQFKRSRFPESPTPEWFAIDFLNNIEVVADADPEKNLAVLRRRLNEDMSRSAFVAAAREYGTRTTKKLLRTAGLLDEAPAASDIEPDVVSCAA